MKKIFYLIFSGLAFLFLAKAALLINSDAEEPATNSTNEAATPSQCCSQLLPRNCYEATKKAEKRGIYKIQTNAKVENYREFFVSCDFYDATEGWTVILRRQDGSMNFFKDWHNYELGFGNLEGEFFIGLRKLHLLTNEALQELLIVMEDFEGDKRYAKYETFAIGSAEELYALNMLGKYSGDAGDSLTGFHAGRPFSAFDKDNDQEKTNCAIDVTGGWWYKNCHESNLMGQYLEGAYGEEQFALGVVWKTFRGYKYSLKYVQMMIRPKQRK